MSDARTVRDFRPPSRGASTLCHTVSISKNTHTPRGRDKLLVCENAFKKEISVWNQITSLFFCLDPAKPALLYEGEGSTGDVKVTKALFQDNTLIIRFSTITTEML